MRNTGIRTLGLVGGITPGLAWLLGLSLGLATGGCRGCSKAAVPHAEVQEESQHARLLSRMADLKIDRSKIYSKDAEGVVACGEDTACFVLQAESCQHSTLSRKTTVSGYGMHDVVNADYIISGPEAGRCRLARRVTAVDVHIDPQLVDAIRAEGKSESDIALLQTQAEGSVRSRNPLRLDCWYSTDDALEVALDLADGNYNDRLFRDNCHEVDEEPAIGPAVPAPDSNAAGGDKAAAAPDEAPAAADKPAADKAAADKAAATKPGAAPKAPKAAKAAKPAPASPAPNKP